jgi:hypothetical protein
LAGFLAPLPLKEGAVALSYRDWPRDGKGVSVSESVEIGDTQQNWVHSLWQVGRTQGALGAPRREGGHRKSSRTSTLSSPPSQARALSPSRGVRHLQGICRGGVTLCPTGGGHHLPPPLSTSSCHVLGHQCFKIYYFLPGCLLRNRKHQVSSSFPQH